MRTLLGLDPAQQVTTTSTVLSTQTLPDSESAGVPQRPAAAAEGSMTDRLGYRWDYRVYLNPKQTIGNPGGCPRANPQPGRVNYPFSIEWTNRSDRVGDVPGLIITANLSDDLTKVLPVTEEWPMPTGYLWLAPIQTNDGDGSYCRDGNLGTPNGGMTVPPGGSAKISGGLINAPEGLPPGVKLVFQFGMHDASDFTVPLS